MIDFILATENLIFTAALVVMIGIAFLEGVATLLGFAISGILDTLVPELDVDSPGLDWLHIGRVPLLVLLVIFLTAFGLIGWFIQALMDMTVGMTYLTAIPAFLMSAWFVHLTGGLIGKIMPEDETEAVSCETFIGREAVITIGNASPGQPAQARLRDKFGMTHYIMVEPDLDVMFAQGSKVLVVERMGHIYRVIESTI